MAVIETADPYAQWVAVRPDTLREGDVTEYALHEGLVDSLFRPGETNMANVAHFMCELATDPEVCGVARQAAGDRERIACVTSGVTILFD